MSIRPGWFWHLEEEPHSLERLFTTYLGKRRVECVYAPEFAALTQTDGLMSGT